MGWYGMAWIWAFLGWTEKDIDTGHGLFLGLRVQLFFFLHFFLDSSDCTILSPLGRAGLFTLGRIFTSFHFPRNKDLHFTLLGLMSGNTHNTKHTYNLKRYTLHMQTSKKKTAQPSK
jgi:hypothetical protein